MEALIPVNYQVRIPFYLKETFSLFQKANWVPYWTRFRRYLFGLKKDQRLVNQVLIPVIGFRNFQTSLFSLVKGRFIPFYVPYFLKKVFTPHVFIPYHGVFRWLTLNSFNSRLKGQNQFGNTTSLF